MATETPEAVSATPRGPIAWMAGNSVAANLVMLTCLIGGALVMHFMVKKEVFPQIARDTITISISYPGASPEEVESGAILSIEEAVRGLDGVKEVSAQASEGGGRVTVEIVEGEDLQKLADDIRSEVDRIRTLPEDAEDPEVEIDSHRREVLEVTLYGEVNQKVLYNVTEQLRDTLLQDPLVTQVEVQGLPDLEIEVAISQENLRRYGLTIGEVANRIGAASLDLPGGGVDTPGGEVLLRVTERRDYGTEFGDLPIITDTTGTAVRLRDIATVTDGFEDTDRYAIFNGQRASQIEVYRVGDQTPIEVSDAARRVVEDFRFELPPGLELTILDDRSEYYRERQELMVRNGAIGLVLVLVILGIFLEIRLAFWVMMGIPISFLGSFLFLPLVGVSINMVTMFAYIIALGIVVDDAIVVGENIYHLHQDGLPFHLAAVKGARAVAMPVVFSILTNIVAFLPLMYMPGVMGKVFSMIPIVVGIAFLVSLVESLFVLPAHLGHQRDRQRHGITAWLHARQQGFSRRFRHWVEDYYGPVLAKLLAWRYVTVALGVAVLFITLAYAASGRMGFDLFPKVESDSSRATVALPVGTPIEKTESLARRFVEAAEAVRDGTGHPELVTGMWTDIGRGGPHAFVMEVDLADPEIRDSIMSTEEFTRAWRREVGEIAGVERLRFESDAGGPGSGRGLTIELSHRDLTRLRAASEELADELRGYPRVSESEDGFEAGKQQLDFTLTPTGRSLGLEARDVARQVRNAYYGAEAIRQQRGRSEIKVMVRLPEDERSSVYDIEELMIRTPAGTDVPLREVVDIARGRAYTTIDRRDGRRVVQVSASVTPRSAANEVLTDVRANILPDLRAKYPGLQASFEGRQAEMRDSLASLRLSFLIAMLIIFALLAIPFRSYLQPFIIMVAIPFGIVGAVIGHLIMGYSLSVISMLGIVALAGVVINDSLVLIDFTNYERRVEGRPPFQAVQIAAIQRFRPILLTTCTTFGGLAPMIFETSRQARFLIPMAISLGFGIVFGTLITLGLIPCLYLITEDLRALGKKTGAFLRGPQPTAAQTPG